MCCPISYDSVTVFSPFKVLIDSVAFPGQKDWDNLGTCSFTTESISENPWCGLLVFEGLSFGHGTKFNKGQIDVNHKVIDLM